MEEKTFLKNKKEKQKDQENAPGLMKFKRPCFTLLTKPQTPPASHPRAAARPLPSHS